MKYYIKNSIHIVEVPVSEFHIVMCDKPKKSASKKDYANCGFFGTYKENGKLFTLPVAHLVCDFDADNVCTRRYCNERGKFKGPDKFVFDASKFDDLGEFSGKKITTLMVYGGSATMMDVQTLPDDLDYAVSGVPIMRDGTDVKFATYVTAQGWTAGSLYPTWHTFIGLKQDGKTIYVMGMKTTTTNMIKSAEAFKKFTALGMYNVIKLDGGGSFYMNVGGKGVASTSENRLINTIITFSGEHPIMATNPYPVPTKTLGRYRINNKDNVMWLQWQLNHFGFACEIDGSFGPTTQKQVKAFQKSKKLTQDGSVGPATRAALLGE